jgi:hypothetical protein
VADEAATEFEVIDSNSVGKMLLNVLHATENGFVT